MSRFIWQIIALSLAMCAFSACNGTLSKTGVYNGDKTLYNADVIFDAGAATVDVFLKYETANRGTPAASASLTKAADQVRTQWPKIHDAYYSARDAYVANKSNDNLTAFQKALADAQAVFSSATTFLTSAKPSAT